MYFCSTFLELSKVFGENETNNNKVKSLIEILHLLFFS